jgi:glycosyltransferase involved in cell wall biosynthesis
LFEGWSFFCYSNIAVEKTIQSAIPSQPKEKSIFFLSLVIPCFNEEESLPELFKRVTNAMNSFGHKWEVICVDDGSKDGTWHLIETQNQRDARWCGLSFARNFGHQIAVSAGMNFARGDAVVVLDADLQDPPEELEKFIEKWKEGYEVVYAIRQKRKENFLKRICYWMFYRLMARLVPFDLPLDTGDFCLMDRRVVEIINRMPERARFVRGLRAWTGFRQIGVSYERHARIAGQPKYTFKKLLTLAWDGIFSFSTVPLRLVSHLGLCISTIALLGIIFTVLQRIFPGEFARIGLRPVPGFATIVILILFLGGLQLFCLGILGEYVGRIYEEVKCRPKWIIKESLGIETTSKP